PAASSPTVWLYSREPSAYVTATAQTPMTADSARARQSSTPCGEINARSVWNSSGDRKSTRLNSSHDQISYAVFCLKKKKNEKTQRTTYPPHPPGTPHHSVTHSPPIYSPLPLTTKPHRLYQLLHVYHNSIQLNSANP